jgi:tape measure domain-containing protein
MADINIGDVTGSLKLDYTAFAQGLRQVIQQLQALNQQATSQTSTLTQLTSQMTGLHAAMQATAASAAQLTQGMATLNQQTSQQSATLARLQTSFSSVQAATQATAANTGQLVSALALLNQQAASQTSSLTTLVTTLQRAEQAMASLGTTTRATASAGGGGGSGGSSFFSGILQVAGGIGVATGIGALAGAMKDFAVSTVEVGARMEGLRAQFSALAGSTAAGQARFDDLFQMAQRLGIAFEPLARGWRTLTAAATAAGIPIEDQRRLLQAVATEGRRVGSSNEELGRAFLALGQMASKGVVSMEELRQQLGEAIPTALAAMAQGMGRTTAELIKLIETGGVTAPSAFRALTRGLEEMQRTGGTATETLQTGFNRFANEVLRAKDELLRMNSGPLKDAVALGTDLLKKVGDYAQAQRLLTETRQQEALIGTGLRARDVARLPPAQRERFEALPALIAEQQEAEKAGFLAPKGLLFGSNRVTLPELQAEQAALVAAAQALKAKAEAEEKATAASKQAEFAAGLQRDTVKDLTTQMDAITKAQEAFRREAAIAPEVFGRPQGAPDDVQKFLAEREQRLRPLVEKLTTSLANLPTGVTLPEDIQARAKGFGAQIEQIAQAQDALRTQERVRDVLKQQVEQLETLILKRQAEKLAIEQGQAAADEFVRQQTAARQLANVQAEAARAQQPLGQQIGGLQAQLGRLRPQAQALGAAAEEAADAEKHAEIMAQVQKRLETTHASQIKDLETLAASYALTKPARDADTAATLVKALADTEYAERAAQANEVLQQGLALRERQIELERQAAASAPAGVAAMAAARTEEEALLRLRERLEQVQVPRGQPGLFGESQEELRARQLTRRAVRTPAGLEEAQQLEDRIRNAQRLNYAAGLFEELAGSVQGAWTQAFTNIAQGTQTVAGAFRQMAQSIIQSLAQIIANEAWKSLIGAVGGAIRNSGSGGGGGGGFSALIGGGGAFEGFSGSAATGGSAGFEQLFAQGGAVINRPTHILAGENPSVNPEIVLNRPQIQALFSQAMRAAPSAGGQASGGDGGGLTIINVPNREVADRERVKQESLGRRVILNEVLSDMRQGEGSQILKYVRLTQR